jgi:hypothetical protein
MAARRLGARADDCEANEQSVAQLVRCAQLSQDAARTLEWALETLRVHGGQQVDQQACQLLGAARARLGNVPGVSTGPAGPDDRALPLAWL